MGRKNEKQKYRRSFFVDILSQEEGVHYDQELKLHFEAPNKGHAIYEIETDQIQVLLSQRLKKAEDITRRIHYMYDWIQVYIGHNGKIHQLENMEELKTNWSELKALILNDYKGEQVNTYLNELTEIFQSEKTVLNAFYQYFHFGLLWTGIPKQHGSTWKSSRIVEWSEYEKEKFSEEITYLTTKNGYREYSISGKKLQDSDLLIKKYEGTLFQQENSVLVERADVEIVYCYEDYQNHWEFRIKNTQNVESINQ
jgi:hypothetical protein